MLTSLSFGWLTNQQEDEHEWPTDPFCTYFAHCLHLTTEQADGQDPGVEQTANAHPLLMLLWYIFSSFIFFLLIMHSTFLSPISQKCSQLLLLLWSSAKKWFLAVLCVCVLFMPNIFAYVDKQSAVNRIYKGTTYKKNLNELFCKDFYASALLYLQPFKYRQSTFWQIW